MSGTAKHYISLFTGAGGLDIGFNEAGFHGLLASIQEGKKMDIDTLPEHLKLGSKTGKPVSNFSHIFFR